eukprot:scaffold217710_cov16-Prasinocladus_malaysianus.AAC.1
MPRLPGHAFWSPSLVHFISSHACLASRRLLPRPPLVIYDAEIHMTFYGMPRLPGDAFWSPSL